MGWLGVKVNGRGWRLEDNEIRDVHATGLQSKAMITSSGGTSSITTATPGSWQPPDQDVFEANQLAFNNCPHFGNKARSTPPRWGEVPGHIQRHPARELE